MNFWQKVHGFIGKSRMIDSGISPTERWLQISVHVLSRLTTSKILLAVKAIQSYDWLCCDLNIYLDVKIQGYRIFQNDEMCFEPVKEI